MTYVARTSREDVKDTFFRWLTVTFWTLMIASPFVAVYAFILVMRD